MQIDPLDKLPVMVPFLLMTLVVPLATWIHRIVRTLREAVVLRLVVGNDCTVHGASAPVSTNHGGTVQMTVHTCCSPQQCCRSPRDRHRVNHHHRPCRLARLGTRGKEPGHAKT